MMVSHNMPTPASRLNEAEKQVQLALDDLDPDHPEAERVSFVVDELDAITDSI